MNKQVSCLDYVCLDYSVFHTPTSNAGISIYGCDPLSTMIPHLQPRQCYISICLLLVITTQKKNLPHGYCQYNMVQWHVLFIFFVLFCGPFLFRASTSMTLNQHNASGFLFVIPQEGHVGTVYCSVLANLDRPASVIPY